MTDPQSMDPEVLVEEIRNGSSDAEGRLVQKYWRGLVIMLEQRTRDRARAEDLAQDAMIVVLTRLRDEGIDNPAALSSYVHQTAKYMHIGVLRKRDSQVELVDNPGEMFAGEETAADATEREELGGMIREMLGELKMVRDRELLMRYYVQEQTKADICSALDLTSEHFDRVLYRARQRFFEMAKVRFSDVFDGGSY